MGKGKGKGKGEGEGEGNDMEARAGGRSWQCDAGATRNNPILTATAALRLGTCQTPTPTLAELHFVHFASKKTDVRNTQTRHEGNHVKAEQPSVG